MWGSRSDGPGMKCKQIQSLAIEAFQGVQQLDCAGKMACEKWPRLGRSSDEQRLNFIHLTMTAVGCCRETDERARKDESLETPSDRSVLGNGWLESCEKEAGFDCPVGLATDPYTGIDGTQEGAAGAFVKYASKILKNEIICGSPVGRGSDGCRKIDDTIADASLAFV